MDTCNNILSSMYTCLSLYILRSDDTGLIPERGSGI